MDCCNYGQYGAGAAWEACGAGGYAPPPYAPYSHGYYSSHAHDPYARYYRIDYPTPTHHMHHAEHVMPMDYGAYAVKEVRARRALARREQRPHHLPLPPTPPLEIGMNGRGSTYGEQQMWHHYQMGVMNVGGWNGTHPAGGGWASRASCAREHMRYPSDCRQVKGPQLPVQNPMCHHEGRSTPYPGYEDTPSYNRENSTRHGNTHEYSTAASQPETARPVRDHFYPELRRSPPEEKRPPVVPLPAFQQAFGSTEIGKFAEAFSRTEAAQDDTSGDNFLYDSFTEWDSPNEPQWSTHPTAREIKCEDNY